MLSLVATLRSSPWIGSSSSQRTFLAAAARSLTTMSSSRSLLLRSDTAEAVVTARSFSTSNNTGNGKHTKFSPSRRPASQYRPTQTRRTPYNKNRHPTRKNGRAGKGMTMKGGETFHLFGDKIIELGNGNDATEDNSYGPNLAKAMRHLQRAHNFPQPTAEDFMRDMDYLTSAPGSTEDLVGERRALSQETDSPEEAQRFLQDIDRMVETQRVIDLGLEPYQPLVDEDGDDALQDALGGGHSVDIDMNDPFTSINPTQLAHGEWGEMVIRVDRNIKLWRGGRIQSYRALVIGGNLNGCAGFGTGKAPGAREAVLAASRKCKRNIFFVDRYQNNSLTRDLVGRSNSCKVVLRATNRGLRGNPLCAEILKYFGITNCTSKAVHGNRSQFNVVRATFKALMTHESMEEIAMKRGRRIVSMDRGRRMQL